MSYSSKKIPRIVYLFTGSRDTILSGVRAGEATDMPLYGLNHIPSAEHLTIGASGGITKLVRALLVIPRLVQYDFVVAQDNVLLGYIVSVYARIFRLKTRWLYLAMTSSVLMRRHAAHPIRLFLLKKFWASYARIVCLSRGQLEDFVRLGIQREHLVFLPFGVDAHFFHPTDGTREEDLIVSIGRDAGRDYVTLFKAAERTHYKYIVVASHKNIPSGMPVPANISVLYDRSYIELRNLYERARLVVIASKDVHTVDGSDCSGQTIILDACAAGKAVIATYRSWITDYFIPDQDLVVVPPNDPEALAQAIDALFHDAEKRKRLASSGHDKVVARYTTRIFAGALLTLMDSIV